MSQAIFKRSLKVPETCDNVKSHVIQLELLELFSNVQQPESKTVIQIQNLTTIVRQQLTKLNDLGFEIDYGIIARILRFFTYYHYTNHYISEILTESFMIMKEDKFLEDFRDKVLIEALKLEKQSI
ncbi:7383_t:CDS:1 [Gigaspora rosea]|nr:7383_t:CDS:1 [Gigaspora rosea]